jgi:chemotaxis protein MotB
MFRQTEKKFPGEEETPEWLFTYSNIITFLLVFFVMIYSFSAVDLYKFKEFITSFQELSVINYSLTATERVKDLPQLNEQEVQVLIKGQQLIRVKTAYLFDTVQSYLKQAGLADMVSVHADERGVALDVKEKFMFDTGRAVLKPEAMNVLSQLAGLFAKLPYQISVEGHTDNRPVSNEEFPSNWELSCARSATIVRYFTSVYGLDPSRFTAVGFAEYRPIVTNSNENNMALNRRVVMVINIQDFFANEVRKSE